MGSTYLGQAAFGEIPPLHTTLTVPAATATADAPAPTASISSTHTIPVANAAAAAPVPEVAFVHEITAGSATAAFLIPDVHGATPRIDVPTSMSFDRRIVALVIERVSEQQLDSLTTDLSLTAPATSLSIPHTSAVELETRNAQTTLIGHATIIVLEQPTSLVLDEHEGVLVLDG